MGHQHHQFVGGALLAIVITSSPASAVTDAPSDTIKPPRVLRQWTAPGGEDDRQFGYSVAINGDLEDHESLRQWRCGG